MGKKGNFTFIFLSFLAGEGTCVCGASGGGGTEKEKKMMGDLQEWENVVEYGYGGRMCVWFFGSGFYSLFAPSFVLGGGGERRPITKDPSLLQGASGKASHSQLSCLLFVRKF